VMHPGWYIAVGEKASKADVVASGRVKEFFKGLGLEMEVRRVSEPPYPEGNVAIVGTVETNPWLKELEGQRRVDLTTLGNEGFQIRYFEGDRRKILVLAGKDRLGVLYATDELSERVKDLEDLKGLNVSDSPRFQLRAYNMVLPLEDDFIIERRMNAIHLPTWLPVGTDFAGQYAGLRVMEEMVGVKPEDWASIEWFEQRELRGRFDNLTADDVEEQIEAYRNRMRELRELGVKVFLSRYEWAFPVMTLARNYYPEETLHPEGGGSGKGTILCLSSPRTREIIRKTYQKTLELFPDVSGLVIYTSSEGDFGNPCGCADCEASFKEFERQLPPHFLVPGARDRPEAYPRYAYFHKLGFDLIYEAAKEARPDIEIVRNTWDFSPRRQPQATEYVHRYTPGDVIFMPYSVSTDTNLREDPNPQVSWWTRHGRRVAPKADQLLEQHPRMNPFPNALDDRVQRFYKEWAEIGVYGTVLLGGWWTGETLTGHKEMAYNIGFGVNLYLHWKLLWNPYREDLEALWNRWTRRVYGAKSAEVARQCLKRAGRIWRLGPKIREKENPSYRDYLSYSYKAGKGLAYPYPFPFDVVLTLWPLRDSTRNLTTMLHEAFVYNYEDYPMFVDNLRKAYTLLDQNMNDLEQALRKDAGNGKLAALLEWFKVEKRYLQGIEQLYKGEEEYLIKGDRDKSAESYSKAYKILREALPRWREIALEQKVWPFLVGGKFHPFDGKTLDEDDWLDSGLFGFFFRWLRAQAEDPHYKTERGHLDYNIQSFHKGLRAFHWPMR